MKKYFIDLPLLEMVIYGIVIALFVLLSSCTHKTIVKNCSETKDNSYFVCDTVLLK